MKYGWDILCFVWKTTNFKAQESSGDPLYLSNRQKQGGQNETSSSPNVEM